MLKYFFPSYRKKKYPFLKDNEVWYCVFITDYFTIPLTIFLSKFSFFTPNAISATGFLLFSLTVVSMFLFPSLIWLHVFGSFLYVLCDDTDGKLARIKGEASDFGEGVDAFFDMLVHGIGLSLVGVSLSLKTHNIYPFLIIFPFSIFMTITHMNHITNIINKIPKSKKITSPKTKWQNFCDERGLVYNFYTDSEIIFIGILFFGLLLKNPAPFLVFFIYIKFAFRILLKFIKKN